MNILEKLKFVRDIWPMIGQKTQTISKPVPWQSAMAESQVYNIPDMARQDNQLSLYEKLTWIQIAISTVAHYAASAELEVYTVNGEEETGIANHPFELLLRKPNPLQSRFELLESTFSFYKLLGNAFWWLNKSSEGEPPAEIWVIPANRMRPVPDKKLYLKGYIYTSDWGQEIPLELWEIVHFKRFNPIDPFNGLSPIEALGMDAQADLEASRWNAKLWGKNNGRLSSILAFQDNYTDDQWLAMQTQVQDAAAKRNIMMVRGVKQGGIQFVQNTISQKDMEFLDGRQFTKEELFAMLSKGLASMLAVNATEANAKTGKSTLAELEIWPMHTAVAEKITNDILPSYGDNLRAKFEDVRMTDRALELQETAEYGKFHTVDEVRHKFYNDDPLADNPAGILLQAQIGQQTGAPKPEQPGQPLTAAVETPPAAQAVLPSDEILPVDNGEPMDQVKAEKARWMRKALKAVKAGKPADVIFESEVIPSLEARHISAALVGCMTAEAVRAVFEDDELVDPMLLLAQEIKAARLALEVA